MQLHNVGLECKNLRLKYTFAGQLAYPRSFAKTISPIPKRRTSCLVFFNFFFERGSSTSNFSWIKWTAHGFVFILISVLSEASCFARIDSCDLSRKDLRSGFYENC